MPEITGIAHVELSVGDLDTSSTWYQRLFDAKEVFRVAQDKDHLEACAILIRNPRTVIAFTKHVAVQAGNFTPLRIGLDHLSFSVANRAALNDWATHLNALGIANNGIADYGYARALTFNDPDGIALEFFCQDA